MKKPAQGRASGCSCNRDAVGFAPVRSIKHYIVLGAWIGFFAFLGMVVRALPSLPDKVKNGWGPWQDVLLASLGLVLLLASGALLGGCIGWLIGWFQANAEKRRRASNEALIVRR